MEKEEKKDLTRKSFVVSRKGWLRGEGEEASRLYRSSDGKMCCLGFMCQQLCGIEPEKMAGKNMPVNVLDEWVAEGLLGTKHYKFALVNDDPVYLDEVRECILTKLFAEHGIDVTFED